MYCRHCSKKIPEGGKFCRHCGNRLVGSREEAPMVDEMVESSTKLEYAGFWIRFGAYIIDLLGMWGIAFAVGLVLSLMFGESVLDGSNMVWVYFPYVIYNAFALSIWSTTFGKYLYGLRVFSEKKEDLNFKTALTRSLLQPFSALLFFGMGYWNMNKNDKKQAWHDKIAKTMVVRDEKRLTLAYIITIIAAIVWASFYSLGMQQ